MQVAIDLLEGQIALLPAELGEALLVVHSSNHAPMNNERNFLRCFRGAWLERRPLRQEGRSSRNFVARDGQSAQSKFAADRAKQN